MKTIIILVLFGLTIHSKYNEIDIKTTKNEYQINDTLDISISNNLDSTIYVIIGLDVLLDNKWESIVLDINDPISNMQICYTIDSNKTLVKKIN